MKALAGLTLAGLLLVGGTPAMAEEAKPWPRDWAITGEKLLQFQGKYEQDLYVMGVIDGLWGSERINCGAIRRGPIMQQALILAREHPEQAVADMVWNAMSQLGCRLLPVDQPAVKKPAGPSS